MNGWPKRSLKNLAMKRTAASVAPAAQGYAIGHGPGWPLALLCY